MKLIRTDGDRMTFRLSATERVVLLDLVKAYPCVPPAHVRHRAVASEDPESAEIQTLLAEALAEQRAATRRQILQLLENPEVLQRQPQGWVLHLRPGDLETLLQVLNDVRVGSWIALGCPDPLPDKLPSDPEKAHHAATMELAGWFEISLLQEVQQGPAP
ncbi:hypothetical protein [Limisphaera sp. VF-2]|jgi:hypothetical protein|uniref:DUF2017 family protein n=1 Tax=Limisphaera sp. VF-2 TaxID=3400418 RepID=UPI00175F2997